MTNPIFTLVFLGSMVVTSYRSVPEQTKPKDYYWTASGEHCNVHGIAVSQDLLKRNGGPLSYGDIIYVEGIGLKFVNDTMNARLKRSADVWVQEYEDEKAFDKKFRGKKLKIWKVEEGHEGYKASHSKK